MAPQMDNLVLREEFGGRCDHLFNEMEPPVLMDIIHHQILVVKPAFMYVGNSVLKIDVNKLTANSELKNLFSR